MAVTLNKITTDLLTIIRGAEVSKDEAVSKKQVEFWIHQYRALLLKRDLDNGKEPHPNYVQEFNGLDLEKVDKAESTTLTSNLYTMRTVDDLPVFLDLNDKIGITFVGSVTGREIQMVSQQRGVLQRCKKYTSQEPLVYIKGDKLYLENDLEMRYITIRGVLEDPTTAADYSGHTGISSYTNDSMYPMPIDKIPALKEMILKLELGIIYKTEGDEVNDSSIENK